MYGLSAIGAIGSGVVDSESPHEFSTGRSSRVNRAHKKHISKTKDRHIPYKPP